MTYILLWANLALITALALTLKQLQHHKQSSRIANQQAIEATNRNQAIDQKAQQQQAQLNQTIQELQTQLAATSQSQTATVECLNQKIFRLQTQLQSTEQAKAEAEELYFELERTYENAQAQIQTLTATLNQPPQEPAPAKPTSLAPTNAIILASQEPDFYPSERYDLLLAILSNALNYVYAGSRREHIITDILANNTLSQQGQTLKTEIQKLLCSYTGLNPKLKSTLKDLGFEIVSNNEHYKLSFQGDSRYLMILAKTPSDSRGGKNAASDICKLLF